MTSCPGNQICFSSYLKPLGRSSLSRTLDSISPTTLTLTPNCRTSLTDRDGWTTYFNDIFAGLPGGDPLGYVEDVGIYGRKCGPQNDEAQDREVHAGFRQGFSRVSNLK